MISASTTDLEPIQMTQMQHEMIDDIVRTVSMPNTNIHDINLNIRQIDGIDVSVYFIIGINSGKTELNLARIKIKSYDIQECYDDEFACKVLYGENLSTTLFTATANLKEKIAILLAECSKIIVTVKFSKILGMFTLVPRNYSFCAAFGIGEKHGIVSEIDDCVVCYDKTKTRTPCKHLLCIPCWAKIKIKPLVVNEVYEVRECPVCRGEIY